MNQINNYVSTASFFTEQGLTKTSIHFKEILFLTSIFSLSQVSTNKQL